MRAGMARPALSQSVGAWVLRWMAEGNSKPSATSARCCPRAAATRREHQAVAAARGPRTSHGSALRQAGDCPGQHCHSRPAPQLRSSSTSRLTTRPGRRGWTEDDNSTAKLATTVRRQAQTAVVFVHSMCGPATRCCRRRLHALTWKTLASATLVDSARCANNRVLRVTTQTGWRAGNRRARAGDDSPYWTRAALTRTGVLQPSQQFGELPSSHRTACTDWKASDGTRLQLSRTGRGVGLASDAH